MTDVLLLMDFQNAITARSGSPEVVAAARRALEAARAGGVAVVFVRVAFRAGLPEVNARNKIFGGIKGTEQAAAYEESSPATQIIEALAPLPGEPVVVKRRFGAFASDLQVVLSGLGADRLVLAGISTSGVVLSTVRQAADLDFEMVVLQDACGDADAEVHRVLIEKVFPRQADVVATDEWIAGLSAPAAG